MVFPDRHMPSSEPEEPDEGSSAVGANWYVECQRGLCTVQNGPAIPFGRLGLSPSRIAKELAVARTTRVSRSDEQIGHNLLARLDAAFREAGGDPARCERLLTDTELAESFKKLCGWDPDIAVAEYVRAKRGGAPRRTKVPEGLEHTIEWSLMRLWCESFNRPDNTIDLLAEEGVAARFVLMTQKAMTIPLEGVAGPAKKAEQAVCWALNLEDRRRMVSRAELALLMNLYSEWAPRWRSVGDKSDKKIPRKGLVKVCYENRAAWIGYASNLIHTLMALESDGMLAALAAGGWWDMTPRLVSLQYLTSSDCSAAMNRLQEVGAGQGYSRVDKSAATFVEVGLIWGERPFLNFPIWKRT